MKLKPLKRTSELDYPEYKQYPRVRRDVLRLLAAGGAAAAASTLVGCDAVRDALGMSRPDDCVKGKMVDPSMVQPSGDDDSADGEHAGDDDSAGGAHPEGKTRGKIVTPDPDEGVSEIEELLGDGQLPDANGLDAALNDDGTRPGIRTSGIARPPDPPTEVRPEVRKKGEMVKPDAPAPPKLAGKPMPPKPPPAEEEEETEKK